jgi:DNA-binding XRE family transcriptional regulator
MTNRELRRARASLNLTQAQLAGALGLHKNTIARIERGELPIVKQTELAVKYLLVMNPKQGGKKHGDK